MKNILLDTNIIVDVLQKGQPHFSASADVYKAVEDGKIRGMLCATTITTIAYLVEAFKVKELKNQ